MREIILGVILLVGCVGVGQTVNYEKLIKHLEEINAEPSINESLRVERLLF